MYFLTNDTKINYRKLCSYLSLLNVINTLLIFNPFNSSLQLLIFSFNVLLADANVPHISSVTLLILISSTYEVPTVMTLVHSCTSCFAADGCFLLISISLRLQHTKHPGSFGVKVPCGHARSWINFPSFLFSFTAHLAFGWLRRGVSIEYKSTTKKPQHSYVNQPEIYLPQSSVTCNKQLFVTILIL